MRVIWHGGPWDGESIDLEDGMRDLRINDPDFVQPPGPYNTPEFARPIPVMRVPLCRYVNSQGGIEERLNWAGRTPL